MAIRALLLDFNGTLSDDEPLLCELFRSLFEEQGKPLAEAEYYAQLSGLADREIVRRWLGRDDADVEHGKPDPAGYRRALDLLGVQPGEAVAIEDSEAGVAAAKAAGLYTVAVVSTVGQDRLAAADELAGRLDAPLVEPLVRG